jgi:LPS export ABC transporter protein LptC
MTRRIFLIASLLLVAALSLFARREHPDTLPGMRRAPEPLQPGYFMVDARVVQTGADGMPLYRMRADRIQQNPADLTIILEKLHLTYRVGTQAQARDWTLTAGSGLMPQNATGIELQDGVEVSGLPQPGSAGPALIRTPALSVDLQSSRVRTDQAVEILWTAGRLTGVGLTADLKTEQVKLESSVHGRFIR